MLSRLRATAASLLAVLLAIGALLVPAAAGADGQRPRVGLVLGGGGARGMAHLGVLKVLEEMRVPVDCVAGTSMGALIGGVYASGATVEEIAARIRRIDWDAVLVDDPPRRERPYRAKRDDFENLFRLELGLRDWHLVLPTGGTSGYKVEFLLRELAAGAGNYAGQNFDYLPIPYRAVATDIKDGNIKVFREGDLVRVMRASMSVPGAIAPVEIDGVLYVDGGLLQNLPVAAAREACADVVIAVNVGSGLLPRKELATALGISLQMLLVLMEQNVRESVAVLGPRDLLIAPELGDFSAANFAEAHALVGRGEDAARARSAALRALSVSADEYRAWRGRVAARQPSAPHVTDVSVATTGSRVNPEVIERELAEVPGIDLRRRPETDFSLANLHYRLEQVYGGGDFERMDYRLLDRHGARTVVVRGEEKSWGPDYVKFGLSLASDSYQTRFGVNLSHRATWVNARGAEWRNDVQLGYRDRVASEFYQPFSNRAGVFVAPRVEWNDQPIVYFLDGRRVGSFQVQTARAHLDFGAQNKFGELRAGLFSGRLRAEEDFGTLTFIPDFDVRQAGYTLGLVLDQIDNPGFPRDGLLVSLKSFGTVAGWGSDDEYNRTELLALGARSWGAHVLQLAGYWGDTLHGELPPYDPFFLGGFLRGSGYRMDELIGNRAGLARAVYSYRLASLPPQIGSGFYVGGSLEATRAVLGADPAADARVRPSASVFVAADTKLGPAYVAIGQALSDGRPRTVYFMLGTP
jgi:NTE family protein